MSHETLNSKQRGMTNSVHELLANIKKLDEQANLGKIPVPIVPNLIDSSDTPDTPDSDIGAPRAPYYPYIYYRWWQRHVSDPKLNIHLGDTCIDLNDDGSHKWRYMTNIRMDGEERRVLEFILRNHEETAELRLLRSAWDKDGPKGKGCLRLETATASVSYDDVTEEDCNALSASVHELMTRHAEGLSAPQERLVTDIAEVFPRQYTVTEQIYSSPFLRSD